eukprot:11512771-Heterocapsa_arctica.AAC.1
MNLAGTYGHTHIHKHGQAEPSKLESQEVCLPVDPIELRAWTLPVQRGTLASTSTTPHGTVNGNI